MRIVTGVPLLVLALCTTLAMATPVSTTTPLSYSTTFTDPSGTPQSVSFTGTASGTSLSGTLTVNGAAEQVTAIIGSDGSVSGKLLNADGSQYGVFWGRPVAQLTRHLAERLQAIPQLKNRPQPHPAA